MKYRVGRKLRRTLYRQTGPEPADTDQFLGILDDPVLAILVARLLNEAHGDRTYRDRMEER
jgi:hypothetical protein